MADVEAFTESLVVVPDIGGAANSYLLMTPRCKWAENFEKWLQQPYEKMEVLLDDSEYEEEEDSEESEEEGEESEDESEDEDE